MAPLKFISFPSLLLILLLSLACTAQAPEPLPSSKLKQEQYPEILEDLAKKRVELVRGGSSGQIQEAKKVLFEALVRDIFPAWYGTPWDFNGVSQTPGEGLIACGYFVTTTLRDAGFKLPRVKLAQQPASGIIHTLCKPSSVQTFRNRTAFDEMMEAAESPGIFILGLDNHVGFLVKDGEKSLFVNADYTGKGVVSEDYRLSSPLTSSNIWMVGDLLGNEAILAAWLKQSPIALK